MTDQLDFHAGIEGYAGRLSYAPGEPAELHVSSNHDTFRVTVHRWGVERELVWEGEQAGHRVATPADADANGCGWPVSLSIATDGWRSGFYLVTLAGVGAPPGAEAHACFVIRAGAERARAVLVLATNTWNAYNTWGGRSLYTGGHQVSFRRPFARGMLARPEVERDDRKSRPTRWGEEPDVQGDRFQAYRLANDYPPAIGSAGWFTHERRFVEWAERHHRFDYCVSSDLDDDPGALDGYDLLIDVGHDEYWSAGQRDTVEAHVARGGNLASLSGNTMFWQVRLDDGPDGSMVCYKYAAHEADPVLADGRSDLMSGLWADPLVGRPEWTLLGAASAWGLYSRFGQATPRGSGAFTVYRHDHWLFEGTDLRYGDQLGVDDGVVGYETVGCRIDFDEHQLPIARPAPGLPEVEIVAFTPSSNLGVGEYPASISALSDQGDLEFLAQRLYGHIDDDTLARVRYGNAVMSVCRPFPPGGGQVVVVGTTDWVFGLGDPAISRVTANILDHLG